MVKNFRYVEPGRIALSGAPQTAADAQWLADQQVGAVVSLHPVAPEAGEALEACGLQRLDFPVTDYSNPLPDDFGRLVEFVQQHRHTGVLIH